MVVIRCYKRGAKSTTTEACVQAVGTPVEIMAQFAVIIKTMRTAMLDRVPEPLHDTVNEMFAAVLMDSLDTIERGENKKNDS